MLFFGFSIVIVTEAAIKLNMQRIRAPLKTKRHWHSMDGSPMDPIFSDQEYSLNETDYVDNFYVADFYIGTPPQRTSLVLDTGSANLWVMDVSCPCGSSVCNATADSCNATCATQKCCDGDVDVYSPANGCSNQRDPIYTPFPPKYLYDPTLSSTYETTGMNISIQYGSGSAEGESATETIKIGTLALKKQGFFSAVTTGKAFAYQPMSGIFGLAYPQIAQGKILPPVNQMIQDKLIDEPIFSMWMEDANTGATGGQILFGGMDESKLSSELTYTNVTKKGYWQYKLDKIEFNGKVFQQTGGYQAVSDSGTSYIIGVPDVITELANGFGAQQSFGTFVVDCMITETPMHVDFTIEGITYQIYAKDLVVELNGACYLGMIAQDISEATGGVDVILGDSFMRNVYHVFDFGRDRIGMAETNVPDCITVPTPTPSQPTSTPSTSSLAPPTANPPSTGPPSGSPGPEPPSPTKGKPTEGPNPGTTTKGGMAVTAAIVTVFSIAILAHLVK
jgi:saccharopepsin